MNFQALVAKLKLESSRQGAAPASPATSSRDDLRLWGWISDAWKTLQTCGVDWKFMRAEAVFTTTPGESSYTQAQIGTAFTRVWPTELNGYRPLVQDGPLQSLLSPESSYDALRRMALSGGSQAVPTDFAVTPSMGLMLYPTPDRAVQVRIDVVRAPLTLVNVGDEPTGLPVHHRDILVWDALKRLAVDDAAGELLQRANTEYDRAWSRLWDEQGPAITIEQARL